MTASNHQQEQQILQQFAALSPGAQAEYSASLTRILRLYHETHDTQPPDDTGDPATLLLWQFQQLPEHMRVQLLLATEELITIDHARMLKPADPPQPTAARLHPHQQLPPNMRGLVWTNSIMDPQAYDMLAAVANADSNAERPGLETRSELNNQLLHEQHIPQDAPDALAALSADRTEEWEQAHDLQDDLDTSTWPALLKMELLCQARTSWRPQQDQDDTPSGWLSNH